MTILTDAVIEKAARALYAEKTGLLNWERSGGQQRCKEFARAALEAVLPDIIEACAKVADNRRQRALGHLKLAKNTSVKHIWEGEAQALEDCAHHIRSLSQTEGLGRMIDRMVTMSELESDSLIYDAYTKGHDDGRIAGLKEADDAWRAGVQHAMNVIVLTGPPGFEEFRDRVIARLTEHRNRGQADIRARISELEKDHA